VALILNNPEYEQKFSFQGYQKDGRNGFLAQAFSPRSLAEKVALILNNPEYEQKFSFQGYQTVKSRFDLSDQVRNFERILERWL